MQSILKIRKCLLTILAISFAVITFSSCSKSHINISQWNKLSYKQAIALHNPAAEATQPNQVIPQERFIAPHAALPNVKEHSVLPSAKKHHTSKLLAKVKRHIDKSIAKKMMVLTPLIAAHIPTLHQNTMDLQVDHNLKMAILFALVSLLLYIFAEFLPEPVDTVFLIAGTIFLIVAILFLIKWLLEA